ncbi:MAG: hypothetical protein WB421_14270 [Terriglobales bacterium]
MKSPAYAGQATLGFRHPADPSSCMADALEVGATVVMSRPECPQIATRRRARTTTNRKVAHNRAATAEATRGEGDAPILAVSDAEAMWQAS